MFRRDPNDLAADVQMENHALPDKNLFHPLQNPRPVQPVVECVEFKLSKNPMSSSVQFESGDLAREVRKCIRLRHSNPLGKTL